jgi:uncharacterized protein (UPF0333 family)
MAKGQASIESLMIIGFAVLLFTPIMLYLYLQSSGASNSIDVMEVNAALSQLATSSSLVNSGSEGSAIFAKIAIPSTVSSVGSRQLCSNGRCITEFVAHLANNGGEMTQVAQGRARIDNAQASLGPGIYYLRINATLEGSGPQKGKVAVVSVYG